MASKSFGQWHYQTVGKSGANSATSRSTTRADEWSKMENLFCFKARSQWRQTAASAMSSGRGWCLTSCAATSGTPAGKLLRLAGLPLPQSTYEKICSHPRLETATETMCLIRHRWRSPVKHCDTVRCTSSQYEVSNTYSWHRGTQERRQSFSLCWVNDAVADLRYSRAPQLYGCSAGARSI